MLYKKRFGSAPVFFSRIRAQRAKNPSNELINGIWLDLIGHLHPAFKREDRLGKEPFAGFGTVVEDITESGYTKNQPILLGPF